MKKMFVRSLFASAAAVAVTCGTSAGFAAVLGQVPVQNYGGDTTSWMLMPMISYHAGDARVHVMLPSVIPQLTPLLVSNPADSFDPGDPWFDALDPSRRGASFSRRYGFVMDTITDPLPDGTELWIRKLSSTADLKFYRYSGSAPKMFEPVFGTDGVTNALHWNALMFHPVTVAPPGTNDCAATFEVFLRDTVTGLEVPDSSSDPFTLEWTNVPDGRPMLNLAQRIVVAWPAITATNWVLESADSANASNWTALTNTPVNVDGEPCVVLDVRSSQQFYRMSFVP